MVMTSVSGHLMELEFPPSHRPWRSCAAGDLFGAPVVRSVPQVKLVGDLMCEYRGSDSARTSPCIHG